MRSKIFVVLILILTCLFFSSCKQELTVDRRLFNNEEIWELNGKSFPTLQEAVDSLPKAPEDYVIKLMVNASGPGAEISGKELTIDFNNHAYAFTDVTGLYGEEGGTFGLTIDEGSVVVIKGLEKVSLKDTSTNKLTMILAAGEGTEVEVEGSANLSVEDNQYVFWAKDSAAIRVGAEASSLIKLNGNIGSTDAANIYIQGKTTVESEEMTVSTDGKIYLNTEKQADGKTGVVDIGTARRNDISTAEIVVGSAEDATVYAYVNVNNAIKVATGGNEDSLIIGGVTLSFIGGTLWMDRKTEWRQESFNYASYIFYDESFQKVATSENSLDEIKAASPVYYSVSNETDNDRYFVYNEDATFKAGRQGTETEPFIGWTYLDLTNESYTNYEEIADYEDDTTGKKNGYFGRVYEKVPTSTSIGSGKNNTNVISQINRSIKRTPTSEEELTTPYIQESTPFLYNGDGGTDYPYYFETVWYICTKFNDGSYSVGGSQVENNTGCEDWYVPSADELNILVTALGVAGYSELTGSASLGSNNCSIAWTSSAGYADPVKSSYYLLCIPEESFKDLTESNPRYVGWYWNLEQSTWYYFGPTCCLILIRSF